MVTCQLPVDVECHAAKQGKGCRASEPEGSKDSKRTHVARVACTALEHAKANPAMLNNDDKKRK